MRTEIGKVFMMYLLLSFILMAQVSSREVTLCELAGSGHRSKASDSLSQIIRKIRDINILESQYVGEGGVRSENYKNYLDFLRSADTTKLIALTKDSNGVVACYASWALVAKSYNDLPNIFSDFLINDRTIPTAIGCLAGGDDLISLQFYFAYYNSLDSLEKIINPALIKMDSMILCHEYGEWLLDGNLVMIYTALQNRIYPPQYNEQIGYLAFVKQNTSALDYIISLNKLEYKEKIKDAQIEFIQQSNAFKEEDRYFKYIKDLLTYVDPKINAKIIAALKKDHQMKNFKSLLESFGLSSEVLEKYGVSSMDME